MTKPWTDPVLEEKLKLNRLFQDTFRRLERLEGEMDKVQKRLERIADYLNRVGESIGE